MPWSEVSEFDQILVPAEADDYVAHNVAALFRLVGMTGAGTAPMHFITQRGPFQDGSTPLAMRWDGRTLQIVMLRSLVNRSGANDWRWHINDLLRPNRSFASSVRPLVYRKWLPGSSVARGNDLEVIAASTYVSSYWGKFVHNGLKPGMWIWIGAPGAEVAYQVASVPNDYSLYLATAWAGATGTEQWRYVRANAYRDLYCLMEQGPACNDDADSPYIEPTGYKEAVRFVCHDPFWYGAEQEQSWTPPDDVGDLIFDGAGAWCGDVPGVGRWLFSESSVGETVDIVYWGHGVAYPTIVINGPATDPVIENATTGVSLAMDYSVAAGEEVTIDTQTLRVENNFGANLYPYLTGDVAAFSISPDPQAPYRINTISAMYTGGVTGLSRTRIIWRNKYIAL